MITVRINYDPFHMSTSMDIGGIDVKSAIGTYDKIKKMVTKDIPLQNLLEINGSQDWKGLLLEIIGNSNEDAVHFIFWGRELDFRDLKESMEFQKQECHNGLFDVDVTYELHIMTDDEIVTNREQQADTAIESERANTVTGSGQAEHIPDEGFVGQNDNAESVEESHSDTQQEKETVYISMLTQIRSGESLKFIDQNVYIQANIDCHGEIIFLDCNVFYNCGDANGKITLSPGAKFNVWNSRVECCAYDDTAFVRGEGAEILCMNSIFHRCSQFISVESSEVTIDCCGVYNCIRKFVSAKESYNCIVENTLIAINDLDAVNGEIAYQKSHSGLASPSIFDIDRLCEYKNNLFYCPIEFDDSLWLTVFWSGNHSVENCTFITLGNQTIHYSWGSKTISNCLFVGGSNVIYLDGGGLDGNNNLSNSMFIGCKNAVSCHKDIIQGCTFVNCQRISIEAQFRGGAVIEDCLFVNTKVVPKEPKDKWGNEIGPCIKVYCEREFMEKGTNKPNIINNCTFYNLNNYDFVIAPKATGKPEDVIAQIEGCRFANCDCIEAIQRDTYYYSGIFEIKKTVRDVMKVVNCEGVGLCGWRSTGKTTGNNEINVNLTETSYGCEYLTSVIFIENGLTSADKLLPWVTDFEQKVILESE
jgi:hypothetical protein